MELGKYKKYAMDRKALRGSDDKRKRSNQISRKKNKEKQSWVNFKKYIVYEKKQI